MELILQILYLSDEDYEALKMGLEVETELDDCVTEEYTFYHIDFIRPHHSDLRYSVVCVSGEEYITKVEHNILRELIGIAKSTFTFLN